MSSRSRSEAQAFQEPFTALAYIPVGGFKIAGIPGIGYGSGAIRIVKKEMDFVFRIGTKDTHAIAQVPFIHAYDIVKFGIIFFPSGGPA